MDSPWRSWGGRAGAILRGMLAGGLFVVPEIVFLTCEGAQTWTISERLALILVCGCAGGIALPVRRSCVFARATLGALAATGVVALGEALRVFVDYPFTLSWSEGSQLWAASLFFRRQSLQVVGPWVVPPYVTSGIYALEGLPFLLPHVGIQWVRLWREALVVLPRLSLAVLAFSSARLRGHAVARAVLIAWAFLFLLQARDYAPLVLCAPFVFLTGVQGRTRALVLSTTVATFYLGISRWLWIAGPPAWALTCLLFVRGAFSDGRPSRRLLLAVGAVIAVWAASLAAAAAWTTLVEHRPMFLYLTTLRHPMLWYRWFPNATSPRGILPWAAAVVLPAVLLLAWLIRKAGQAEFLWRAGVVGTFTAGFAAMGLLASAKMGGGDNLHSMDMLLVYIVLVAGLVSRTNAAEVVLQVRQWPSAVYPVAAISLVLPVIGALEAVQPIQLPDHVVTERTLQTVGDEVREAAMEAPVLFIDQRQLTTFDLIPRVPFVMQYDLADLMDHAMADDQGYLQQFYSDLEAHKYSLIVSCPLPVVWRGSTYPFGEENDVWVQRITIPILEWYEPVEALDAVGVWLLRPRPVSAGEGMP
jgi:hypothetical protein